MLVGATVASVFLVAQHFGAKIPGCGPTAGCAELQTGAWGRIPGIQWPIAFVGLAYFGAMLIAWATSGGKFGPMMRGLAWVGLAASVGFAGLMVAKQTLCVYCAAAHVFNLVFVAHMEAAFWLERRARRDSGAKMKKENGDRASVVARVAALGAFAAVFVLTSAGLAFAHARHLAEQERLAEAQRADSAAKIIEKAGSGAAEQPVDRWGPQGFTGRYRRGPAEAKLRFVVLTDYQCPDCRRVEGEIEEILKTHPSASLSVKHFPMCVDCNKYAGRTLHRNACWAARAAEAAGILGGDEAFFKMHDWLFEVKGEFITTEDLAKGVAKTGLDVNVFGALMQSAQTLKNVQADVEDGIALGLHSTPMVFINGVEFKGWQVPGALKRTVDQVLATDPPPPPRTSAADRPVLAAQRFVEDWKEQPRSANPEDKVSWSTGAAAGEGVIEIIVYGDYQEENTVKLNAQIMEAMKTKKNVRYTWRHYPVDRACNPALPAGVPAASIHPLACKAAKAAEAAGLLGGNEAYWKMHQWLLDNWRTLSDETIRAAVKGFGWDVDRFTALAQTPNVVEAIEEDCRAARMIGLGSVPYVFVNRKLVPRALREGDNVVLRVLEAAEGK